MAAVSQSSTKLSWSFVLTNQEVHFNLTCSHHSEGSNEWPISKIITTSNLSGMHCNGDENFSRAQPLFVSLSSLSQGRQKSPACHSEDLTSSAQNTVINASGEKGQDIRWRTLGFKLIIRLKCMFLIHTLLPHTNFSWEISSGNSLNPHACITRPFCITIYSECTAVAGELSNMITSLGQRTYKHYVVQSGLDPLNI